MKKNYIKQSGFSLVELLLVITTVGFLVILMASIPNALNLVSKSKHVSLAREIATKQLEDQRSLHYTNLANGQVDIADSRVSLLPSGSGTVLIEDCSSAICTNNENTKQITVTVNWKSGGKDQNVVLKTLISEEGINQ